MQDSNHIFFDELSIIFSEERLDGYLNHAKCNNSKTDALIAYSWNIELSQSLYPALQILEDNATEFSASSAKYKF